MPTSQLSVREIEKTDIESITKYWLHSDTDYLTAMGVDLSKIPGRDELTTMLSGQLNQSYREKKSYCIIWQSGRNAIGHSNINKIIYGEEAYMHLHIWNATNRKKGYGSKLISMTLPYFFNKCQLKKILCEPYALNPAPNKTLQKSGFKFIKEHITIPGSLNFEQKVNLWEMSKERFMQLAGVV